MPAKASENREVAIAKQRRKAKFQTDLAPSGRATGERKALLFPRLERVAPSVDLLPRTEVRWTSKELECLAKLASAREAPRPTGILIRAMRD